MIGFPLPERYKDTEEQKQRLQRSLLCKDRPGRGGNRREALRPAQGAARYLPRDRPSNCLHKDIGYQGMVYLEPESPYIRLVRPFVEKKQRDGLDFWVCTDKSGVDGAVYTPFIVELKEAVPEPLRRRKYPAGSSPSYSAIRRRRI
ncbi:uncharacterized protein LY79DRAFT_669210 [Colletotrichum navitas]|uniref:Uncharacterized protein n=1 Tax=Colletotrichum navitas TaxID=681940 RepID=A0AAD8V484_9PEZI|nr:uncharacterized protein LY79DRAFT_669210 [Colletotrichum navitas]KAK1593687.1 hypothetical protein LY79DRAFT_669210 [Colletotrichum navitas]